MKMTQVARVVSGRCLLDELQEVRRNAGTRGDEQSRENRYQGSRRLIGIRPLRRPSDDDRAVQGHADVVRRELHRLLKQTFAGLEGDEGANLEREAIATLL